MSKEKSNKKVKLTLVRSLAGRSKAHQQTAQCLGLRRMHQSVEVFDNPSIRGMVNSVGYLLKVEEL